MFRTPWLTLGVTFAGAVGVGATTVVFGFLGHVIDPALLESSSVEPGLTDRVAAVETLLRATAAAVFLVATTTAVTLLWSRAERRRHELALCVALGAGRWAILRPLLVEGGVLAGLAAAAGVLTGFWATEALPSLFFSEDLEAVPFVPRPWDVAAAALIGFAVMVATTVAIRVGAPEMVTGTARGPSRFGRASAVARTLLTVEVALSTGLLLSLLPLQSRLEAALRAPTGTRIGEWRAFRVAPAQLLAYPAQGTAFAADVSKVFERDLVGFFEALPGSDLGDTQFAVDAPPGTWATMTLQTATMDGPALLKAGALSLAAGRAFSGGDSSATCPVAVVDVALAERLFSTDPLGRVLIDASGQRVSVIGALRRQALTRGDVRQMLWVYGPQGLRPDPYRADEPWRVPADPRPRVRVDLMANRFRISGDPAQVGLTLIDGRAMTAASDALCAAVWINEQAAALLGGRRAIGTGLVGPDGNRREVVGIVRQSPIRTLQSQLPPTVFHALGAQMPPGYHILTQARVDPGALAALATPYPRIRVTSLGTLHDHVARIAHPADHMLTSLVSLFAGLALVLAIIGVGVTTTDAAARRSAEFALRLALGAGRRQIVWAVVRESLGRVGLGLGVGAALAALTTLVLEPTPGAAASAGPLVWGMTLCAMLLLAAVASAWPARRASAIDPAVLLRD